MYGGLEMTRSTLAVELGQRGPARRPGAQLDPVPWPSAFAGAQPCASRLIDGVDPGRGTSCAIQRDRPRTGAEVDDERFGDVHVA